MFFIILDTTYIHIYNSGMNKHVVIVESPTKAKTISKFLSKEYEIIASIGHIRDLPKSASDIPEKYKKEGWARLGINIKEGFSPLYVTVKGKGKIINKIKHTLKEASSIILATDEDREGESIAHHIIKAVKPKVPIKRMVFHEITKSAILHALQEFRNINPHLVEAQETRRVLDRLFGFRISELLWRKITYKLSAGRVQSPCLRLLVEREKERAIFKKTCYADISLSFEHNDKPFTALLSHWENKKIAVGSDFNKQGILIKEDKLHLSESDANNIAKTLKGCLFNITNIKEKPQKLTPPTPFITSTLQQESNKRFHLSARDTMRIAQSLYERGFITYMRTDSPALSSQAIQATRNYISQSFDEKYLPLKPRLFFSKNKSSQEAHEAIRPAGTEFQHPNKTELTKHELSLYSMIWEQTIASQMTPAEKNITSIELKSTDPNKPAQCSVTGSILVFPGFLAVYKHKKLEEKLLPAIKEKQTLTTKETIAVLHETKPPARYNDASIIKHLESLGIGRPSTYASIINTLLDREYARRVDQSLVPTLMGFAVVQFLEKNFNDYVDYNFTAEMEEALDKIANGKQDRLDYLKNFYFGENGLDNKVTSKKDIDADLSRRIHLDNLPAEYEVRVGPYGPFTIVPSDKEKIHVSIPKDCSPADINKNYINKLAEIKQKGPQSMGKDPKTDKNVYCLTGRYGPYVQLGEATEEEPKPRRTQLPRGTDIADITLEKALKLLEIPKILGKHPETQEEIIVKKGPYGPYIECGSIRRSLRKDDSDEYTIKFDEALTILTREIKNPRASKLLKELGEYNKKKVALHQGPYGVYIKYGTKNVRIPKERNNKETVLNLELKDISDILK